MHYVKQFNINGVDTKQVACIELQAPPNSATEGCVGVLGIDMSSPTHDVYKCVARNGSVYTWELLSAGMSIMSATITGEGALEFVFPYENLLIPSRYLAKPGDLILDSEGYLYKITSIGTSSCNTEYCGTHIGGIASGDKDRKLIVTDGKLQLVTESGAVLSEVDYMFSDDETIYRDPTTGEASIIGVNTINGKFIRFFIGTSAEHGKLTPAQKQNLFAVLTDDNTKGELLTAINNVNQRVSAMEGTVEGMVRRVVSTNYDSQGFMSLQLRVGRDNAVPLFPMPENKTLDDIVMLTLCTSEDNGGGSHCVPITPVAIDEDGIPYRRYNFSETRMQNSALWITSGAIDIYSMDSEVWACREGVRYTTFTPDGTTFRNFESTEALYVPWIEVLFR